MITGYITKGDAYQITCGCDFHGFIVSILIQRTLTAPRSKKDKITIKAAVSVCIIFLGCMKDMQIITDIKITKVVSMVSNGSNDVKQGYICPKDYCERGSLKNILQSHYGCLRFIELNQDKIGINPV